MKWLALHSVLLAVTSEPQYLYSKRRISSSTPPELLPRHELGRTLICDVAHIFSIKAPGTQTQPSLSLYKASDGVRDLYRGPMCDTERLPPKYQNVPNASTTNESLRVHASQPALPALLSELGRRGTKLTATNGPVQVYRPLLVAVCILPLPTRRSITPHVSMHYHALAIGSADGAYTLECIYRAHYATLVSSTHLEFSNLTAPVRSRVHA